MYNDAPLDSTVCIPAGNYGIFCETMHVLVSSLCKLPASSAWSGLGRFGRDRNRTHKWETKYIFASHPGFAVRDLGIKTPAPSGERETVRGGVTTECVVHVPLYL